MPLTRKSNQPLSLPEQHGTQDADAQTFGLVASRGDRLIMTGDRTWVFRGCELSPLGASVPENFSRKDFIDLFGRLFSLQDVLNLWIGDLVIEGEALGGLTYDEVGRMFSRKGKTIQNWASTLRSVPKSLRGENPHWAILDMGHYEVVQALPRKEQIKWLDMASKAQPKWSVAKLAQAVRGRRSGKSRYEYYLEKKIPDFVNSFSRFEDDAIRTELVRATIADLERLLDQGE